MARVESWVALVCPSWLRDKVHRHGQRFHAPRLIEQATGLAPSHRPYVQMLKRKFGELYEL